MTEFNENLGRRIRNERRLRGFSQKDLGKAIGVTFQQIQKYENGKNRISVETLEKMCRFLAIPMLRFLMQAEDAPPLISKMVIRLLKGYRGIENVEVKRYITDLIGVLGRDA